MRTPDFLIVGAAKSGTTSLSNYLDQHPKIKIVSNRLEYFGEYTNTMMKDLSQEEYLDLFSSIPEDIATGEKSASYLYSDKAPQQIKNLNPRMQILIILRNPVDRAYSDYWHRRRNQMESLSFEDALRVEQQRIKKKAPFELYYANYGLYAEKVENYFSMFGREQCRVFLFKELIENPQEVCKTCFEFLGVGTTEVQIDFEIYNKGTTPKKNVVAKMLFRLSRERSFVKLVRNFIPKRIKRIVTRWMNTNPESDGYPKMNSETRNYLRNFFKNDIIKLEKLLGKDLGHWLK